MKNEHNILICPLEWGLGHAGRMIPLARLLKERHNNIFVGAGKKLQELFRSDLQGLNYIDFKGFRPRYSKILPQYIVMLLQLPILIYNIVAEHLRLKKVIMKHSIDIVISDNRFGLWNRQIKSIYITHQPLIPFPGKLRSLEWTGVMFHRFFMKKYSACLIPDLPGELNLTGRLTHGMKLHGNTRFIGILSRFNSSSADIDRKLSPPFNTLIITGPEPQRTLLRQKVIDIFKNAALPLVVLEGKPGDATHTEHEKNVISYNHLPADEMKKIITDSSLIIARSGYSTIMELISLNRTALLVPTPGQTEQEYLAKYLSDKGWFTAISQKKLESEPELSVKHEYPGSEIVAESSALLEKALDEILNQ